MSIICSLPLFKAYIPGKGVKLCENDKYFSKFEKALACVLGKLPNGVSFVYEGDDGSYPTIIDYYVTTDSKIEIYYDRMRKNSSRVATKLFDCIHVFHYCDSTFRDFNLLDKIALLSEKNLIDLLDKLVNTVLPD
jgi:hypothetical protein